MNCDRWLRAEISQLCKEEDGKWIDIRFQSLLIQEVPAPVATRATKQAEALTFLQVVCFCLVLLSPDLAVLLPAEGASRAVCESWDRYIHEVLKQTNIHLQIYTLHKGDNMKLFMLSVALLAYQHANKTINLGCI